MNARLLLLCLLCLAVTGCGVKRPLHLEGYKKGQHPPVDQPVSTLPTTSGPISDQERMINTMTGSQPRTR